VLHLYGTVKAAVTGQQPTELTEQEKVDLKG
jgi:hypothetical protein